MLATGQAGVIAFEAAYHGLGYGALNLTHRDHFRSRFRSQLGEFGHFVPFPKAEDSTGKASLSHVEREIRRLLREKKIGAILAEPIQVRGGINVPPPEFLRLLRELCDEHGALLVLDEIYTGFGRTGRWFACEHQTVVPDLICLGKALTNGFPLSACVGRADLMDAAWPPSQGEAIHTSTFLGNPVGCAMALAQILELNQRDLVEQSRILGQALQQWLRGIPGVSRGLGLLAGVELRTRGGQPATSAALAAVSRLLHRGFIFLPEGAHSNVISFSPPLVISKPQLRSAVEALGEVLAHISEHLDG